MSNRPFQVTFDYRCPFARNAHEHLLAGLADGADWDVTFIPLSLSQMHREEGDPPVWDEVATDSGLRALATGTAVRDRFPDRFPEVHRALFALRHDEGKHLDAEHVSGLVERLLGADDAAVVLDAVEAGDAVAVVRKEHEAVTTGPGAWGVPTFVAGDERAMFVRLMDRNPGETREQRAHGRRTVERILDLVAWTDLNELKAARIPK